MSALRGKANIAK